MSYEAELAEYREAKAALGQWDDNDGYGPAHEVEAAWTRVQQAAYHLADAVDTHETAMSS